VEDGDVNWLPLLPITVGAVGFELVTVVCATADDVVAINAIRLTPAEIARKDMANLTFMTRPFG
jgi:hypothetical protein